MVHFFSRVFHANTPNFISSFAVFLSFCVCVIYRNVDQLESLPELSYHGLGLLCSTIHGEGDEVGGVTLKRPLYFGCTITLLDHRVFSCIVSSQSVSQATVCDSNDENTGEVQAMSSCSNSGCLWCQRPCHPFH